MGDHTHVRAGGGKETHDHDFDPADGHAHDGMLALPKKVKAAELDAAARKGLSDLDYAYIDSKGKRHFPISDEAHVRAAISRFSSGQFESPEKKATAARKIRGAAKKYGIDVDEGSAVMKASEAALVALQFGELVRVEAGEKQLPFLVTGQWHFDDYGEFTVTPERLDEVHRNFDESARRQDIPVINEDHDPSRAIGWIKNLIRVSPTRLDSVVDFNPVGDSLVANDQYRYVSPEVLRNYVDTETGQEWGMTAAGLALTNKPRLKALGRIAAAEVDAPSAAVLCFGESAGSSVVATRKALLAEDDGPADPIEMCLAVPCCWAPPFSPVGRCPGFTRATGLVDGDGDQPGDLAGCCLLAVQCNGYAPVGDGDNDSGASNPSPLYTSYFSPMGEGHQTNKQGAVRMGEQDQGKVEGQTPAPASEPTISEPVTASEPTVPAPAPTPVTPSAASTGAADAAETRNLLKAAEQRHAETERRLQAAEGRAQELENRLNAAERAKVLDGYRQRLDTLRDTNRITPAVHEKLAASESLMRFSEDGKDGFLDALEQLPGTAIPMAEIGKGTDPGPGQVDEGRLIMRMNAIHAEKSQANPRFTFAEAAKAAALEVYGPKGEK